MTQYHVCKTIWRSVEIKVTALDIQTTDQPQPTLLLSMLCGLSCLTKAAISFCQQQVELASELDISLIQFHLVESAAIPAGT